MADHDERERIGSNPAERLLALLKTGDAQARNVSEATIKNVWARVLGAGDNDSLLLRRLGFVYGMPLTIREHVAALPDEDPGFLLKQMPKIEGGLQRNIYEAWENLRVQVDESARDALERISFLLNRARLEPVVRRPALNELLIQVMDLRKDVEGSAIDDDLRAFLLRQLKRMELAMDEVRLLGAAALQDSAEAVVGSVGLRIFLNDPKANEREASSLQKVSKIAGNALMVVNLIAAPFNLAIAAQNALGSGDPAQTVIVVGEDDEQSGAAAP